MKCITTFIDSSYSVDEIIDDIHGSSNTRSASTKAYSANTIDALTQHMAATCVPGRVFATGFLSWESAGVVAPRRTLQANTIMAGLLQVGGQLVAWRFARHIAELSLFAQAGLLEQLHGGEARIREVCHCFHLSKLPKLPSLNFLSVGMGPTQRHKRSCGSADDV